MGCNSCKKNKKNINDALNDALNDAPNDAVNDKKNYLQLTLIFLFKIIAFIFIGVITIIIVSPYVLYILFKMLFLNEGVDFTGNLVRVTEKFFKKDVFSEEDNDDDDDDDDNEDYQIINIEDDK
jgi:hypothetical protein